MNKAKWNVVHKIIAKEVSALIRRLAIVSRKYGQQFQIFVVNCVFVLPLILRWPKKKVSKKKSFKLPMSKFEHYIETKYWVKLKFFIYEIHFLFEKVTRLVTLNKVKQIKNRLCLLNQKVFFLSFISVICKNFRLRSCYYLIGCNFTMIEGNSQNKHT